MRTLMVLIVLLECLLISNCASPQKPKSIPMGTPESHTSIHNPIELQKSVEASPIPLEVPKPTSSPQNTTTGHVGFKCVGCTKAQATKVASAELMANEVLQGTCFQDFMAKRPMIWTQGKTDQQVIDQLKSTNLTVPVHYYWGTTIFGKCNGTIGYRQPPYPDVYFNECYHQYYDACDEASNGTHEWSHTVGYGHPFKPTNNRGYTVPYSINAAFEKCCKIGHGFRGDVIEKIHK